MLKKALAAIICVIVVVAILALRRYGELMPVVVRAHAVGGSINCGTVTNSDFHNGRNEGLAAIDCAKSAYERRQPFFLVSIGHGIDEVISHALVADGKGNVIQLFYGTGMVRPRGLLKNRCTAPVKFEVEEESPYGFPRLHCAPWPPKESDLSTDFLFW